ncbi:MAG: RnfABCDGE type electron transport complex subunit D [Ruminococcus sp.]|nr:RnfABCDGE type electron transport complex subunit D [Ruminococcus sp.]
MLKKVKQERFVWMDIFITLLALEIMAYFYYGFRAVLIAGLCVTASFACEYLSLIAMRKKFTADNLSCINDGFIIALMMPATIDYKIPVLTCIFANIVGKNIFGGRKNMIFSPAAVGYLFALTSFGKQLLEYPNPFVKADIFNQSQKLVSSASHIFNTTGKLSISDYDIVMGNFSGPMGAVSILLLLISSVILLFRKDLSAGSFIGFFAGLMFMSAICPIGEGRIESAKYLLATNMTLFAGSFIISDVRIAPEKKHFSFFYGLFIALISYVLLLTSGQENIYITVAVIMTPAALALKQLEKKINKLSESENAASTEINTDEKIQETDENMNKTISEIAEDAVDEINKISESKNEEESNIAETQGDDLNDVD